MKYINHLSKRGADFLHPGSKKSTDFFIQEILKRNPNSVLEIGCGTGASLVSLASNNINNLTGIDINPYQVEMAKKRIQYCGLQDSIQIYQSSNSEKLPFEDNSIDIVFAESVLGILKHHDLIFLINEVKRVLSPNGIFLTNDAIWKENLSQSEVEKINRRTLKNFGLIQSSGKLIGLNDWINFFKSAGFNCINMVNIDNLPPSALSSLNSLERKSKEFTFLQKQNSLFNLSQIFNELTYRIKLNLFHRNDVRSLEHQIFILHI